MALTKVTNDLLALGENTSSLNLPKGTTAQRPSSPVAGMVRENTDDNVIEYYNGTEWKQVLSQGPAILVDYLVVAGGGSGASRHGGGGGSGGYLTSSLNLTVSNQYTITIGAGGADPGPGTSNRTGNSGVNSVISGANITTVTAIGGGGGGSFINAPATSGGSGGGGANQEGGATPGG